MHFRLFNNLYLFVDEESSLSIEEIADKSGCASSKMLYPIMRALAQWGIGIELENKRFTKNQAMEILRRDKPGAGLGHAVEYHCSEEHFSALRFLAEGVKQNKPAFELDHGMNHFEYMQEPEKYPYEDKRMFQGASKHAIGSPQRRKEFAEAFDNAMEYWTVLELLPDAKGVNNLYKAYPWSKCKKIADMGGCSGYFIASILKQKGCQHIQGYVLDLPEVIQKAKIDFPKLEIAPNSVEFIPHDITKPFPNEVNLEVDTVIFKNVISLFISDEGTLIKVLQNCRSLLPKSGGKVLVIDYCIPDTPSEDHKIGFNGLQLGFWSLHYASISCSYFISKSEWVQMLDKAGSRVGYQVQDVYDTFPGGCTIFELCYHPLNECDVIKDD